MSMETTKRVWQARLDPRRNTASIGIYSHVRDRWGIFYAQPFVLNERQAGVAIEGVVRQERIEISQLGVDTHGYTNFAMGLARLLGFDLCPRLRELKQRHLYVPRGTAIPAEIASVCVANVDTELIEAGRAGASDGVGDERACQCGRGVGALRLGPPGRSDLRRRCAARQIAANRVSGRLLRQRRVPARTAPSTQSRRGGQRAEARHLHRARELRTGQTRRRDAGCGRRVELVGQRRDGLEHGADADHPGSLGQSAPDHPAELIGRIAPTRLEGINLRGVFRFPIERYADQILPSQSAPKTSAIG
jgi:hypothetical protein